MTQPLSLSSTEVNSEFGRLFWAARKEQQLPNRDTSGTGPHFIAAQAFARSNKWQWAEGLVEASRLSEARAYDDALRLLREIRESVPSEWLGLLYFIEGSTHSRKGDYAESADAFRRALSNSGHCPDEKIWNNLALVLQRNGANEDAIAAFQNALKEDLNESNGRVWNNLGAALLQQGQISEAILAFRKAVEDPRNDQPGIAWNNLGIALSRKGDNDEAIASFVKAFDDPNYTTHGDTWNNIGVAHIEKDSPEEAIKAFHKALEAPQYSAHATTWANIGGAYLALGSSEPAMEAFRKTLTYQDTDGASHARARLGLQVLSAKITPDALSPNDRALVARSSTNAPFHEEDPESKIIDAIQRAGDTQYDKYIDKPNSGRDDTLSILRGWSSAVTLLEGSERRWRGGGYFLKWRGCGIVVDPGFDFLRNFHDAGYHGREIRVVAVSHHHPDHNSDLKDIDDLRYELYKRLVSKTLFGSEPYVLLWDQDTSSEVKFGISTPAHHFEPIIFASGFPQSIDLGQHASKLPVRVIPFKVKHGADVPHAMGMVIELLDQAGDIALRIGYTADTAYFEDLQKHLSGCDVLIAHISQPSIEELQDASKTKDVHLGYRGTARLLRETKPKVALIGEFWAGYADLRIALVKGLRRLSGVEATLPAGLAMHLSLPSLEVECTECARFTAFGEIKVAPPTDIFGSLAYLCPNCLLQ